jgi:hypothetical protein
VTTTEGPSARRPVAAAPGSWPLLAQPWAGGVAGWLVVFGGLVADIVGGIATNKAPVLVATLVLALLAAVPIGLSIAQFLQTRSCGAERASWWHLGGIAAAALAWLTWPTSPGMLDGVKNARQACFVLIGRTTPDCLSRASHAFDGRNLVWWLTGALIVMMALLFRRARMAAWAAIPVALAGCLLATHFLELLLLHYRPGG